jgi:hypothetical protein
VTPFEVMDDHLADAADPASTVAVDRAAARRIADRTDVSVARARGGFAQLPMPLGVSGVGAARLATAADRAGERSWLPRSAYAVGRAGAADAAAADIVAGGNLAASLSYGDVTMAGVGTATSVCGERVVGFGHPLEYQGRTTLGLHPADAIYIQDDLVTGFKVANLGDPVGTITDDRLAGITGTFGTVPDTTEVTSALGYGDRHRTGTSHVSLHTPDALASTTFYELVANHQAVVDGPVRGTEDVSWTITGGTADGAPFALGSDDLYASAGDLTWRLGFTLGDLVYAIARVPGVTIDSVSTTGELADGVSPYRVAKVEARQGGHWVRVDRRTELLARGGRTLTTRVTLQHGDTTKVVPGRVAVPDLRPGRTAYLQVAGGSRFGSGRMPRTIDGIATWLDRQVRSDELVVSLTRRPHYGGGFGGSIIILGRAKSGVAPAQQVSGPYGGVVRGNVIAPVVVR